MSDLKMRAEVCKEKLGYFKDLRIHNPNLQNVFEEAVELLEIFISTINEDTPIIGLVNFNERNELRSKLVGPNSLLIQYLDKEVIIGGKGKIKPSKPFKQYTDDICSLSAERLVSWPEGFYRNNISTNTQLLLKSDKYITCIDKLPSFDINVHIYDLSKSDSDEVSYKELTVNELKVFISDLEDTLKSINNLIFNEN